MHGLSPLASVSLPLVNSPAGASGSDHFGTLMRHALRQLSTAQTTAETDVAQAISGQGSVTQAMVHVAQAQTDLDVATSIRNALVQAGTSVMNLQI